MFVLKLVIDCTGIEFITYQNPQIFLLLEMRKHDSKSKNEPKQRRYSKKKIEGNEKRKRTRYRGKKKKGDGEGTYN